MKVLSCCPSYDFKNCSKNTEMVHLCLVIFLGIFQNIKVMVTVMYHLLHDGRNGSELAAPWVALASYKQLTCLDCLNIAFFFSWSFFLFCGGSEFFKSVANHHTIVQFLILEFPLAFCWHQYYLNMQKSNKNVTKRRNHKQRFTVNWHISYLQ